MPSSFVLPNVAADVFIAARIDPAFAVRDGQNYQVYARFAQRRPLQCRAGGNGALARQTAAERPANNARWSATAAPLLDDAVGDVRTNLLVLLGAVLFALLLCCVNVANLYLDADLQPCARAYHSPPWVRAGDVFCTSWSPRASCLH
jgi:hypothetical protein